MILVDFSAIMFQSIFASPNVAEAKLNENNKYNSKDLESYLNYEIKKLIDYGKIKISSIEQCGFFKSDI